jgi:hypothetical protein
MFLLSMQRGMGYGVDSEEGGLKVFGNVGMLEF